MAKDDPTPFEPHLLNVCNLNSVVDNILAELKIVRLSTIDIVVLREELETFRRLLLTELKLGDDLHQDKEKSTFALRQFGEKHQIPSALRQPKLMCEAAPHIRDLHVEDRSPSTNRHSPASVLPTEIERQKTMDTSEELVLNSRTSQKSSTSVGTLERIRSDLVKKRLVLYGHIQDTLGSRLILDDYDVRHFYHTNGVCQYIARAPFFTNMTLFIIFINAIYLGVDVDYNRSDDAQVDFTSVFSVTQHCFTGYYLIEWIIRFGAFKSKGAGFRDRCFVFDSFLVMVAVADSWILPLILVRARAAVAPLRLLRLSRLIRLSRIIGTFLPEMMTMTKGVIQAYRAVLAAFTAIGIATYIFAIVMTSIFEHSFPMKQKFGTVGTSMFTLLIFGVFQASSNEVTTQILSDCDEATKAISLTLFVIFLILTGLTILNMLIGIQCEVVTRVGREEREADEIGQLKSTVLVLLRSLDSNGDGVFDVQELATVMDDADARQVIRGLDININHFFLYCALQIESMGRELLTAEVLEYLLLFRGDRPVTVKVLVENSRHMLHQIRQEIKEIREQSLAQRTFPPDVPSAVQEIREPCPAQRAVPDDEPCEVLL